MARQGRGRRAKPSVDLLCGEAEGLIAKGNVEKAVGRLTKGLELYPDNVKILDRLIDLLIMVGDLESVKAGGYIETMLRMNPNSPNAAHHLCNLANLEESQSAQISCYTKAAKIYEGMGTMFDSDEYHRVLSILGQSIVRALFATKGEGADPETMEGDPELTEVLGSDPSAMLLEIDGKLKAIEAKNKEHITFWSLVQRSLFNLLLEDYKLTFCVAPKLSDEEANERLVALAKGMFKIFFEWKILETHVEGKEIPPEATLIGWANVLYYREVADDLAVLERPEEVKDLMEQFILYQAHDEACLLCDIMLFEEDTNLFFLYPCAECHLEMGRKESYRERLEAILDILQGEVERGNGGPEIEGDIESIQKQLEELDGGEEEGK